MIEDSFIKYGLEKENIEKAIEEIDFSDKYFWSQFRWGLYNGVFILFEYNRFYGNIIRQIAFIKNEKIIKKDCSEGEIENIICSVLNCEIEYNMCINQYQIENLFKNKLGE